MAFSAPSIGSERIGSPDMSYKQIIHRYWSGPKPMPEEYVAFGEKWEDLNPGWAVVDHGEEIIQLWPDLAPVFNHLYERDGGRDSIELHVQVADVVGYALLREFGGIYVNTDMEPLRPLSTIINESTPSFASYENYEDFRIVNAAIGAPRPYDVFWSDLLDGLPARYFSRPYDEMVMSTGPGYLTDFYNTNKDKYEFQVFPKSTFNPIHWGQIGSGGDASGFTYPEDSVAVHHWGHKKDGRSNYIEKNTHYAS